MAKKKSKETPLGKNEIERTTKVWFKKTADGKKVPIGRATITRVRSTVEVNTGELVYILNHGIFRDDGPFKGQAYWDRSYPSTSMKECLRHLIDKVGAFRIMRPDIIEAIKE